MSAGARSRALEAWVERALGRGDWRLEPASADASFRAYHRVRAGQRSWIVMDAPPEHEDTGAYLAVGERLAAAGIHVPRVLEADARQGFVLMEDLGPVHYLDRLDASTRDALYGDALSALARMQSQVDPAGLPAYDQALLEREAGLFGEWFLHGLLELTLDAEAREILSTSAKALAASAAEQPRCFVHRDYHSRNLMVTEQNNPGVLDFQGALHGPVTYDLVSLLRDCYVAWEPPYVQALALAHHRTLRGLGLASCAEQGFLRWLDLMGVQRHLKAIGIFARLRLRDGKRGYLADIPRTLVYVEQICPRHPELAELGALLQRLDLPARLRAAGVVERSR